MFSSDSTVPVLPLLLLLGRNINLFLYYDSKDVLAVIPIIHMLFAHSDIAGVPSGSSFADLIPLPSQSTVAPSLLLGSSTFEFPLPLP
ncbi:hypothetical protein NL676_034654 [Syzygium grande]|nr:hypothetical protein NL676_034654 [Syzygium grande]